MKLKLIALLVLLVLIGIPTLVLADPWSAIDSGYAVTTNYHGVEVVPPPDPPLRAKVGLLTENFYFPNGTVRLLKVQVDLRDPDGNVVFSTTVYSSDFVDGTSPKGKPIKYNWTEPLEPATWTVGHYSVKAYFYATDGKQLANCEDLDAMRATTVMMVPEVPIGTLTILLTMLAGIFIFTRKRF